MKVIRGGEIFKERQIMVLRQTANLVNLIPPQLPNLVPLLEEKLSNPINSSEQRRCSIVCQAGLSQNLLTLC